VDRLKIFLALKARNMIGPFIISAISHDTDVFRAFSAFENCESLPGALPQAVTFRAFGA
jgi:hypothetical protein